MKPLTKTIIVLFFLSNSLFSQEYIAGSKILNYPEHYNAPTSEDDKHPLNISAEVQAGIPWIVYSDENGNTTYTEPGGTIPLKNNLQFLEHFYVIGETEGYLHIVKDSRFDAMSGILSNNAINYGWIKKKDLLLWSRCLVTEHGKISQKAMLMNTQDLLTSTDLTKIKQDMVRFYKNAERTKLADIQKKILDIFFIYKTKGNSVLLGINALSNFSSIKTDIIGWVDKNRVLNWDHRICLEPNFDPNAANERKQKGFKTTVFRDVPEALLYSQGNNISSQGWWNADPFEERLPGQMIRFPVYKIDTINNTNYIVQMGMMGRVTGTNNRTINQVDIGKIKDRLKELKRKSRNINIVFVIDGTKSMRPYFASVSSAVTNSMNEINEMYPDNKNNIRFAAVVYRDYSEGRFLTEIKPLTSERNIATYLNNVYDNEKNKNDRDVPEAVYEGLKKALISTGIDNDNTNVIILIGDAGNHINDTRVSEQEIIDSLSKKKCHFYAFQVHNNNTQPYKDFISQISNLILSEAQKIYDNYPSVIQEEIQAPTLNNSDPNNIFLQGSAITAGIHTETEMSEEALEKSIINSVKLINDFNNSLMSKLNELMDNGASVDDVSRTTSTGSDFARRMNPNDFTPALYEYLNRLGLSRTNLNIIKNEKYQLYNQGATPLNINGLSHNQYKFVLFLNQKELTNLVIIMEKLLSATNAGDRRISMKNFFIELIKEHIGELSEDEQLQMNISKIWEKTTGLPFNSNVLQQCTLAQITDELKFSDTEINNLANTIKQKHTRLNRIVTGQDKSIEIVFESNNGIYYWIEQDLLP